MHKIHTLDNTGIVCNLQAESCDAFRTVLEGRVDGATFAYITIVGVDDSVGHGVDTLLRWSVGSWSEQSPRGAGCGKSCLLALRCDNGDSTSTSPKYAQPANTDALHILHGGVFCGDGAADIPSRWGMGSLTRSDHGLFLVPAMPS